MAAQGLNNTPAKGDRERNIFLLDRWKNRLELTQLKLLVLDGNSILNRAFYGIKLLSTKEGLFTNGIYGFMTMLMKLKEESSPDGVAIAFDLKAPTFRHKAYDGYKAQRKGMPEELAQQLPVLKELLSALGYHILEAEGFEADDILGTLAAQCERTQNSCIIATGDRDSLQLVSEYVTVRIAATKMGRPEVTVYDRAKIMEVYGIEPRQLIDVKALQGDSSDNIPGVPGIGQKGALDLIQRFGNLDVIYENIETLDIKAGMKNKLIAGKDSAYMSRMLGTISTQAPVPLDLEEYIPKEIQMEKAAQIMSRLEFFSLMEKMGIDPTAAPSKEEQKQDAALFSVLREESFPLEGDEICFLLDEKKGKPEGLLLSRHGSVSLLPQENPSFFPLLRQLAGNKTIKKCGHNIKEAFSFFLRQGWEIEGKWFDAMLAGYLLNPSASSYDIPRLCGEYGVSDVPIMWEKTDEELPDAVRQAASLPGLAARLSQKMKENSQTELYEKIELPLAQVLASMEQIGFEVDVEAIKQYGKLLELKIELLQNQIFKEVGYTFNLNSPKQLGEALFEKLQLPTGKKTKSGYSTSAEVLENLRMVHPAVDAILEYRTLAKLKSTYCDALVKLADSGSRIHSNFNQTETRTGRISSTDPNLQNIPVRTEVGRELRRFFRAQKGWTLIDADYSQIELRVLAHIADDKAMQEAFRNEEDIHRITAAQVFGMPPQMVTPMLRSRAKAVNFGIVYGIGAFSLSKDIGVSRKEAENYIEGYLNHYTGVRSYMEKVVEEAKKNGYVETMFGRRRYLPELSASNFNLRSFGERVAKNMPIQGTAADIIKIAMIRVYQRLRKEGMRSRLILQVHDELIVEAPEEEAVQASAILKEEMEHAVTLSVPLTVDCHMGKTWFEAKGE